MIAGSGFVGRHLLLALAARGYHVRALARSPRARDAVAARGAEPVDGDLLEPGRRVLSDRRTTGRASDVSHRPAADP
ncbi:MAG: NAD-dependent epimerase/dehydratase family protein [Armatimonadetes bacterium]|nr:NAD-dependent epimerase/dehydratase family protein [Armatimonadota bacterium]